MMSDLVMQGSSIGPVLYRLPEEVLERNARISVAPCDFLEKLGITSKKRTRFLAAIRNGASIKTAVDFLGISTAQWNRIQSEAKKQIKANEYSIIRDFYELFVNVRARRKMSIHAAMYERALSTGDPKTCLIMLENVDKEERIETEDNRSVTIVLNQDFGGDDLKPNRVEID